MPNNRSQLYLCIRCILLSIQFDIPCHLVKNPPRRMAKSISAVCRAVLSEHLLLRSGRKADRREEEQTVAIC